MELRYELRGRAVRRAVKPVEDVRLAEHDGPAQIRADQRLRTPIYLVRFETTAGDDRRGEVPSG